MKTCVYPGSFDPITFGHLAVIEQAADIFDRVVVVVASHPTKKPLFHFLERIELISTALSALDINAVVVDFSGAVAQYALDRDIHHIARGIRSATDFEYELTLARANSDIAEVQGNRIETVYFTPPRKLGDISSTIVREICRVQPRGWKLLLNQYVPSNVAEALVHRFDTAVERKAG